MPVDARAAAPLARPRRGLLSADPADALARVLIAGLFLGLAWRIAVNFLATGRPTGLLLLASELLVVVLMLARRSAIQLDRRWPVRAVAAASIVGPFLLQPVTTPGLLEEPLTTALSAAGLALVVGGKLSLGRSFGLLPANRGIVSSGLYRLVRHPIYAGCLLTHVAFLLAHPTMWNLVAITVADSALVQRARLEEQVLARDPLYRQYHRRVRWRLVPYLY